MAENPQVQIGFGTPRGDSDIYVNTLGSTAFSELQWADQSLGAIVPRRVLRLPLFIKALSPWVAEPKDVVRFFGFTAFKDLFYLALSDAKGNILREAPITPVFLGLIKEGKINLQPGEVVFAWVRIALFDLASLGNQDVYATLQLDPAQKYPGIFTTDFSYWRLGVYSVEVLG